jgi:hypothetical protein
MAKQLKFRSSLVPLVLTGQKTSTWRLFDDKNLTVGDEIDCVEFETGERFAKATITAIVEKALGSLTDEDKAGHEQFASDAEMYATYATYYGRAVGPDTRVKIAWFTLAATS